MRSSPPLVTALALACLVCTAFAGSTGVAQSLRRGVRVRVTSIEGGGGWSGTAFVSVPPSRLTASPATGGCDGVVIVGEGRSTSGRIRSLRIELRGPAVERVELPLGAGGCVGASLTLGLDDGSSIEAEAGTVTTSLSATGEAHGSFTATTMSGGTPLAIAGELTLAPRAP